MAGSWSNILQSPVLLNPHILHAVLDLQRLETNPNVAASTVTKQRQVVKGMLNLAPRLPDSVDAELRKKAGIANESYLIEKNAPGHNSYTHAIDTYMPPIRAMPGVYISGKPDISTLKANGGISSVADIKTTYFNGKQPTRADVLKRLDQPAYRLQAGIYAKAFGLPYATLKGYGYANTTDAPNAYAATADLQVPAISSKELYQLTNSAVRYMKRAGLAPGMYRRAEAGENWQQQIVNPISSWRERGVLSTGFRESDMSPLERDAFNFMNLQTTVAEQDEERRLDREVLKTYIPGIASTNTGFSIENTLSKAKKPHNREIPTAAGSSGPGAGEGTGDIRRILRLRNSARNKWVAAQIRGEDESAWRDWNQINSESSYIGLGKKEHERKQTLKDSANAFPMADRIALQTIRWNERGWTDESNELIRRDHNEEIKTASDLAQAISDITKSRRDEAQAIETTRNIMSKLGDTSGSWYDWTRWHSARTSQWQGIKGAASGILPGFLERPLGHLGDAYIKGQWSQMWPLMGAQRAFENGVMPILGNMGNMASATGLTRGIGGVFAKAGAGAAIGAGAGSVVPGVGTAAGAVVMGSIGLVQGISQLIGNIGEAKIQSKGFDIQSRLHLLNAGVGVGRDIHSVINRIITTPLKLLGNTIKWGIPIMTGLFETVRRLTGSQIKQTERLLGRPNLTYTADMSTPEGRAKGWYDYIWSRAGDLRVGLQEGSIQAEMENWEKLRQGILIGQLPPEDQIIAEALAGNLQRLFGSYEPGNAWQEMNNYIRDLNPHAVDSRQLALLSRISPTLEQVITAIKETGNKGIQDITSLIESSELGSLTNYWASIMKDPTQYRDTAAQYGVIQNIQGFHRMNIANSWWKTAGANMEMWWVRLLANLEKAMTTRNFGPVGATLVEGASGALGFVKDIVGGIATTLLGVPGEDGQKRLPTFSEGWESLKEKIVSIIPKAVDLYTTAWIHIADAGYKVIRQLSQTIWNTFYQLIDQLADIKIDWNEIRKGNIFGAFTTSRVSTGDVFSKAGTNVTYGEQIGYEWGSGEAQFKSFAQRLVDAGAGGDAMKAWAIAREPSLSSVVYPSGTNLTRPGQTYYGHIWQGAYRSVGEEFGWDKLRDPATAGAYQRRAISAVIDTLVEDEARAPGERKIWGVPAGEIDRLKELAPKVGGPAVGALFNSPESILDELMALKGPADGGLTAMAYDLVNMFDGFVQWLMRIDVNGALAGPQAAIKEIQAKVQGWLDKHGMDPNATAGLGMSRKYDLRQHRFMGNMLQQNSNNVVGETNGGDA